MAAGADGPTGGPVGSDRQNVGSRNTRSPDGHRAPDASEVLEGVIADLNGVDLVIISAGAVTLNPDLRRELDSEVIRTNVTGFMAMSQTAMRHFLQRGYGHLVGITSMAALRGDRSLAAYAASKSFQCIYLDGLQDLVKKKGLPITVTEAQPGFVDTAMMKTDKPLPSLIRRFMVASPQTAAKGIMKAIQAKSKHVYITSDIFWLH